MTAAVIALAKHRLAHLNPISRAIQQHRIDQTLAAFGFERRDPIARITGGRGRSRIYAHGR